MSAWPENELLDRADELLNGTTRPGAPGTIEVRVEDIVIFKPTAEEDIYVLRGGSLVVAWSAGDYLPSANKLDLAHALDVLQRHMVLDDLAGV